MKRSHLARVQHSGKIHKHHHLHFRKRVSDALHHLSQKTGEPVHVLEQRFADRFNKLPVNERYAIERAVLVGGFTGALVAVGAVIPEILPLAGMSLGIGVGVSAAEAAEQRKHKREFQATLKGDV